MRVKKLLGRPLNWRFWVSIATLATVLGTGTYSMYRLDRDVWEVAGPQEGYYWTVAQYHLAFKDMREVLRAEALGDAIDHEEHQLRADILDSKAKILTQPSELTNFFRTLDGYRDMAEQLREFQERVLPVLHSPTFAREDAVALLPEFRRVERLVIRFANEVRVEEIRSREATMAGLQQRRMWVWIALSASSVVLVAWLVTLRHSERRYRRKAEEEATARRREHAAIKEKHAASKELEAAVRAKSNFLGMVSHELRSPLQDILSSLEILERRASGTDAEFVARVRRSANALKAQLQDLLTLATGEAGRLEVRPETFEGCDLLSGVLDMFAEEAAKKGIRLIGHVPDEPVFAIADAKRIIQVLTNLVSNAVKYTDKGRVDVTLKPFDTHRSELIFVVSDTGRGIAGEYQPTLFSAYTRFDALGNGGREGAGIGLAIVHIILKHLGGEVEPISEVGKGTTFTVRIPATLPKYADSRQQSGVDQAHNLLFVDDRPEVLDALANIATELGYTCDKALSAAIAANLLAASKYDVVFIDLDMPIKDGLQLASETRRGNGPNAETRLVAISAADGRGVGNSWPFNAFLEKPIDRWALSEAISPRMPE